MKKAHNTAITFADILECLLMNSAVDWLMSKFRTTFARNSKFHIRKTILCQFLDSIKIAGLLPFSTLLAMHSLFIIFICCFIGFPVFFGEFRFLLCMILVIASLLHLAFSQTEQKRMDKDNVLRTTMTLIRLAMVGYQV